MIISIKTTDINIIHHNLISVLSYKHRVDCSHILTKIIELKQFEPLYEVV